MADLTAIRKWHPKKLTARVHTLAKELTAISKEPPNQMDLLASAESDDQRRDALLDEAVVICLASLKIALEEGPHPEVPVSALDIFEEVYTETPGTLWVLIFARFRDTKNAFLRFASGSEEEKKRLRPQLLARGML